MAEFNRYAMMMEALAELQTEIEALIASVARCSASTSSAVYQ